MMVTNSVKPGIPLPAIGMDNTSWFNRFLDKGMKTSGRGIWYSFHAYTSYPLTVLLSRYDYQYLALNLSTTQPFFQATQITLINLNSIAQTISSRSDHCTPEFMKQCPSSLVTTPKYSLQSQCADPVFLASHPPHGTKPCAQRQMSSLKNRASDYRCLVATLTTFIKNVSYRPSLSSITPWTTKTLWPTKLKKIMSTSFFGRKPRFKFHKSLGIIFHTPEYYILG